VPMDAPAGTHATLMASVNGDAQAPIVRD
jgi:hypothetical protein